jgi:probable rRNA maturation factor
VTPRKRAARRLSVRRKARAGRGREPRVERDAIPRPAAKIAVAWDGIEPWLGSANIVRAARAALAHGGRPDLTLSVVFVSDRALARLHERHLGDPSPTDVITFDLSDALEGPSGEIYASSECARRTARERGVDPRRELVLYVVHGALHLCGFDDRARADRARMRVAETHVLDALGYARDDARHDA